MNAQVVQLAPINIAILTHIGPYEELSPVFDRLWQWVTANGVPAQRTIGIYWDNPDFVAANRLRSGACVEVPPGFQLTSTDGLPLAVQQIAGGNYVTTEYVGPYEGLAPVWSNLTTYIERTLGRQISSNPAFEIYVNDPSDTPPDSLITELYMPVI